MIVKATYKDLRPVLMDKEAKGVKIPYYQIEDKEQVIFVVSPGLNGIEFNKTAGYLSTFPGMQTYLGLYGSGILLMQRNDELGEAKEFKVVRLSPHKQVNAPAGWIVCLVNTGNSFLVVLRSSVLNEEYKVPPSIIEKSGLAYYVIEKKGEITFEPNPRYIAHPQITTE